MRGPAVEGHAVALRTGWTSSASAGGMRVVAQIDYDNEKEKAWPSPKKRRWVDAPPLRVGVDVAV